MKAEAQKKKTKVIIVAGMMLVVASLGIFLTLDLGDSEKIVWYAAMLEDEWELYEPVVDAFTEETGIEVEVRLYGGEWENLNKALEAEVTSGQGVADVVTVDDFDVISVKEYVEDLTEEVELWGEWDELYSAKRSAGVLEDKIYFIPWRADCLTMYVNEEKLTEHGLEPPETMEDLLEVAESLYEDDGIGRVGMKAKKYEGLTTEIAIFTKAYGGDYTEFNSSANVEAFELLQELSNYLHPSSQTWDEGTIPQALADDEVYILFNWPYQASLLEDSGLSSKIKAYINPRGPVGRGTTTGGGYLGISQAAPNKDNAWRLLEYLSSKNGQGRQLEYVGWLPTRDDAWDHLKEVTPAKYSLLSPYRETSRYALIRPPIENYSILTGLWQDVFWDIVWEGEPVQDTLDEYQTEWETVGGG